MALFCMLCSSSTARLRRKLSAISSQLPNKIRYSASQRDGAADRRSAQRNKLREHRRQERGLHHIPDEDKPKHTPRSTSQLLVRCGKIGPHVGAVAEQTYRRDGPESIRRIMGLIGLARKHGAMLVLTR